MNTRPICDTPGCGQEIPPGGEGHPEICPACLKAEREAREKEQPATGAGPSDDYEPRPLKATVKRTPDVEDAERVRYSAMPSREVARIKAEARRAALEEAIQIARTFILPPDDGGNVHADICSEVADEMVHRLTMLKGGEDDG